MTQIIVPEDSRLEVADILRKHIVDYQDHYPLFSEHRKIVFDLLNCRSAHLGGHIDRCSNCGMMRIAYHSCRNRHCPKLRIPVIANSDSAGRRTAVRMMTNSCPGDGEQ